MKNGEIKGRVLLDPDRCEVLTMWTEWTEEMIQELLSHLQLNQKEM